MHPIRPMRHYESGQSDDISKYKNLPSIESSITLCSMHQIVTRLFNFSSALLALILCVQASGQTSKPISIDQLDWLTGNWHGSTAGGILEETWLIPKANTITALVRFTKAGQTEFVEIIKIEKIRDTLELRLQLFDHPMEPRWDKPQVFKLLKLSSNKIIFSGVTEDAHRELSYERVAPDHFIIRFETKDGSKVKIDLSPQLK